ncbi:hypothetical protein ACFE04_023370 [Oxalis oulophora]
MVDRQGGVLAYGFYVLLLLLLFESTSTFGQLSSYSERVALLQLRSSLGIRTKEWSKKADPCLNWIGITCNNGSVVGINISGFKRTRLGSQNPQFSVDALANFTRLLSFNASKFSLPGSIPDLFGQRLGTLEVLDLKSCSITGLIPSSMGNLTNLKNLCLADNSLTGGFPSSFSQLLALQILDLSHNSLAVSIPDYFGSLTNLTRLDISMNYLYGSIPDGLGKLLKLQYLNVSSNSLSGSLPAQLGNLDSLVDLDLSMNSLIGDLPANLFPAPSQLQVVILRRNNLTGEVPEALWSISSLRLLDISVNNFTGSLPNTSSASNVSSAQLNISQNKFYGSLSPFLRSFISIDLSGNYFEGKVDYVSNASLKSNCLQNETQQKSLDECTSFYAERGLTFDNFGQPNSTIHVAKSSGSSKRWWIILAAVLGALVVVVFLIVCFLCICKRGSNTSTNQRELGVTAVPAGNDPRPPPGIALNLSTLGDAFTHQQLVLATGDFSDINLIKHGHSGDLFKGVLENGTVTVIKRIDLNRIKKETYLSELDFFNKVSHPRFVPFLGHCLENQEEKFLVYKYMPYKDLANSLYRKDKLAVDDTLQSLDWITRLKIAIGTAEALSCLHHDCNPPIVHRDIQASSILLDDKFEVRLGSLSEFCVQEGEAQPSRITRLLRFPQSSEQGSSGQLTTTCSYDVYCFGKVLLGLVTGKIDITSEAQTKEWFDQTLQYISIYDKELVTKIVDPSLIVDEDLLEEVWAMAIVAKSCLNPKPSRRPLMKYILKALENPLKVVREDSNNGSARLRTTSSRSSWNAAAVFGSWRHSSSDVGTVPATSTIGRVEVSSSVKQSGNSGSLGSNGNGDHSSSRRRHSKEIFPEPLDVERQGQEL